MGRLRSTEQENQQPRILRKSKLKTMFQAVDCLLRHVMGAGSDFCRYYPGALFLGKDEGLVMCQSSSGPVVCMQTGPETRKRCSSHSRLCWGQGLDPAGLHLHQVGDNRLGFFQVLIFTEFSSLSLIICLLTSFVEVNHFNCLKQCFWLRQELKKYKFVASSSRGIEIKMLVRLQNPFE